MRWFLIQLCNREKYLRLSITEPTADENSSDEVSDNKEGTNESEVEVKEEETTPAAESTSEQPRGIGGEIISIIEQQITVLLTHQSPQVSWIVGN